MTVTSLFKTAALARETNDVLLVLLTIAHADISPSIRVVNNNEDITSNGNVFTAFPFDISLPDSREGSPPVARLGIDNVSREIAESIRAITTPATVTIEVIRASAPDTIEKTWAPFTLRNVSWDMYKVSGDLRLEEIHLEPFPAGTFNPSEFPGVL